MITPEKAINLILAGNAILTFKNKVTQNRFTYKIRMAKNKNVFFVSVLNGPDNTSHYAYMGIIEANSKVFRQTPASKISEKALSLKGFKFVYDSLQNKQFNTNLRNLEIWHEGKCCRCGRKLTDPESIERGLGPECCKK
jgi:hypothetical protein